jgi:geranylgeranyl reductase family protein
MSSARTDWDVVVVGAGPAGSTSARHLAQGGARVLLIDRQRMPRYKTCGGGLVGRTLRELPEGFRLPVERSLHSAQLAHLDCDLRFLVEREQPVVTMTMRADFDAALVHSAQACGAEFDAPRSFEGFEQDTSALRVHTDKGSVRTSFLIGADGVLSPVAKSAGWKDSPRCIPALECELAVDAETLARFAGTARFDFAFPGNGYGWVFPKREHLSVGVLSMQRGRIRLQTVLREYLERIGIAPGLVDRSDLHGYVIGVQPRPGDLARGRVLLAGDAAGLADPVTAEGISYAMQSGRACSEAFFAAGAHPERVGPHYQRGLAASTLAEHRVARFLADVVYRKPRARRRLFRWCGQPLCEGVVEVIAGHSTYRELVKSPRAYLRLLGTRTRRPDSL